MSSVASSGRAKQNVFVSCVWGRIAVISYGTGAFDLTRVTGPESILGLLPRVRPFARHDTPLTPIPSRVFERPTAGQPILRGASCLILWAPQKSGLVPRDTSATWLRF